MLPPFTWPRILEHELHGGFRGPCLETQSQQPCCVICAFKLLATCPAPFPPHHAPLTEGVLCAIAQVICQTCLHTSWRSSRGYSWQRVPRDEQACVTSDRRGAMGVGLAQQTVAEVQRVWFGCHPGGPNRSRHDGQRLFNGDPPPPSLIQDERLTAEHPRSLTPRQTCAPSFGRVAGARCPRARALQQQQRIAKHWLQMVCPTANAMDISGAAWRRSTPKRQALQRRRLSARPLASWTTERQRWWYCSARHTCALDDRSRSAAQSESLRQSGSGCVAIKAARLRGSIASPSHCG